MRGQLLRLSFSTFPSLSAPTSWSPKTMATQCETRKILDARPSERALVLWHNSIPLFCLLEHHHHWIRLGSPSSQLGHSLDPGCLCMKAFPSLITPSLAHVTLIFRGASLIVSTFCLLSFQVQISTNACLFPLTNLSLSLYTPSSPCI